MTLRSQTDRTVPPDAPAPSGRAPDGHDGSRAQLAPVVGETPPEAAPQGPTVVLLVEDDDGDALLVQELLIDAAEDFRLVRARTLQEAMVAVARVDIVVLDLGLPDAMGLVAVQRLRIVAGDVPLVVLTGAHDRLRGLAALASGAQDYLVKGEVDGLALGRSIRYAVERSRAESAGRQLLLAEQRQAENERLARGLLPRLGVAGAGVRTATRYLPGGNDALLGGDFFDALQRPDGTVRAIIGDVCGHGPAEAAIGVALRIAWRTMVLYGAEPEAALAGVDAVLRAERDAGWTFATVCDVTVCPDQRLATVRVHGHPPPLLLAPAVTLLEGAPVSPPLGILDYEPARPWTLRLPDPWALLLSTDGLHEIEVGGDRLGLDRLVALASDIEGWVDAPDDALARLLDEVSGHGRHAFGDDVALLWLGSQ